MDEEINIGFKLRHVRESQKMTQKQLSELSGLSTAFISQIERGKTDPSWSSLKKFSAALNIKIKDQAPKDYMMQVKQQCTGGKTKYGGIDSLEKLKVNMAENCIPDEVFDMDYTRYEEFLEKRRHLMAKKICRYYDLLK